MSFVEILKEGGLVPYILKAKNDSFLDVDIYHLLDIKDLNTVQKIALVLLSILIVIFGVFVLIIAINYLVGFYAAKAIIYMAMNIFPHLLGLLLFSYYYIGFIVVLWYFGFIFGRKSSQASDILLPGNMLENQNKK